MKQQNNNLATTTKWVADIPLSNILDNIDDTSLNLVTYTIPAVEITSSVLSYQGNEIEVPTGVVNPTDKTITFNYLLGNDWTQYLNLYRWVSALGSVNAPISDDIDSLNRYATYSLPIRVYILDEFKNIVLSIKYENAWISQFSEISMDYSSDPIPINHSFTIKYSNFVIEQT